jgi:hypothetical protein
MSGTNQSGSGSHLSDDERLARKVLAIRAQVTAVLALADDILAEISQKLPPVDESAEREVKTFGKKRQHG